MSDGPGTTSGDAPDTRVALALHVIAVLGIDAVILLAMLVFHDFFITSGGSFYIRETILGVVILAVIPLVLLLSLLGSLGQRPEHIVHRAQFDMAITRRVQISRAPSLCKRATPELAP